MGRKKICAEIKKHTFLFCLKKITKKRKFTSQFFEKKFHPKFFSLFFHKKMLQEDSTSFPIKNIKLFRIFYNLLASLGIANFKLDCDSYLFLFSLSLTLLSLLLKQLLLSLNL